MSSKIDRKGFLLLLLYAKGSEGKICEPIRGRTRLAKLLFLLKEESWTTSGLNSLSSGFYNFEPDNYGPFDTNVFIDIDFLRAIDFIDVSYGDPLPGDEINEYLDALRSWALGNDLADEAYDSLDEKYFEQEVSLTETGKSFVKEKILNRVKNDSQLKAFEFVKSKFGSWSLTKLLRYIYLNYPKMASKSRIRKEILNQP